eukprot:jgi/Undpi1/2396/HiC_scaffold_13.g05777.m1
MPHHEDREERKKGRGGRHGKDHDEGHGRPGHKHHGKHGGRHGKQGAGHGRHSHSDSSSSSSSSSSSDDSSSDEEDKNDEVTTYCTEAEHPGWRRAGRVGRRKWKRENNVDPKMRSKDLNPEQRKEIRIAKRVARRHFVAARKKATAGQLYGGGGWDLSPRVVIGSRATKIIFASPGDGRSVTGHGNNVFLLAGAGCTAEAPRAKFSKEPATDEVEAAKALVFQESLPCAQAATENAELNSHRLKRSDSQDGGPVATNGGGGS